MKKILLIVFMVLLSVSFVFSADNSSVGLTDALQKMSSEAIESYLGGLPSGFLTNLNSGWFHKNPKAEIWGINFEFGVVAMGVPMGEMDENFNFTTDYSLTKEQAKALYPESNLPAGVSYNYDQVIEAITKSKIKVQLSGPTVFGSKSENVVVKVAELSQTISILGTTQTIKFSEGASYPMEGVTGYGDDISGMGYIPTAAPQLTFGTIYGTSFSFRYVPKISLSEDFGDFSYFGMGAQHNPKLWIPYLNNLPFDYSFAYYYQKMEIGSLMKATAWSSGINVSKEFGWRFLNITPYTSFLFEGSKFNVAYDYKLDETNTVKFDFDIEGENKFRWVLGTGIRLGIVNITADYSIAKTKALSASLNVAF